MTDTIDTPSPDAVLRERLMKIASLEGGAMWFGWPERWWDDLHWRCRNDHVSRRYLKSEGLGYCACLKCYEPVHLTYPEDEDGPLPEDCQSRMAG
jgi:hypothetical protein